MAQDDLLYRFMQATIDTVNQCMCHIYAIRQSLLTSNTVDPEKYFRLLKEAETLPDQLKNSEILKQMIEEHTRKGDQNGHP